MRDLWAILGVLVVAGVYQADRRIGLLLFVVVFLAMVFAYQRQRGAGLSFETYIPPTVH